MKAPSFRLGLWLPGSAGLATLALYLSFPAAKFNFDGVACAVAVELGDLRHLVHGNHLAYGILGYWWFSFWKALGYSGPALLSLQALSSLFGAAGVGVFAHLLLQLGLRPRLAMISAFGLAVSEYYWVWSLESQVYLLGAFFMILTAHEATRERPHHVRLGLFQAGAVLGHVGNVMLIPAVLYLLGQDRRRQARYLASMTAALLISYALAGVFCIRPHSFEEIRVWLLGSAALSPDRSFNWHGSSTFLSVAGWMRHSLRLWGAGPWSFLVAAPLAAYGALSTKHGRLAPACVIWLAGYACLFLLWEPGTPVYRVTDLAPLWLLMALGMEALSARRKGANIAYAGFVALLGAWNLLRVVRPNSDPRNNVAFQTTLAIGRQVPENAWVVASGLYQIYVPYFVSRHPIDVRYYEGREALLQARLRLHISNGEPVFVMTKTLAPQWQTWFAALPHEDLGGEGEGRLYRLR